MPIRSLRSLFFPDSHLDAVLRVTPCAVLGVALSLLVATALPTAAGAQSSNDESSSSSSSSSTKGSTSGQEYQKEKSPTLDPAGPTISLISSEPVFVMAAALNACGYDEGLDQSAPVRKRVRDEITAALGKSEKARDARDKLCLFIAQHRMTGSTRDIAQYISLALYLTPPPELETSAELTEMPPDSTQVVEILPLLREFTTGSICTESGWPCIAPTIRRPTGYTTRSPK